VEEERPRASRLQELSNLTRIPARFFRFQDNYMADGADSQTSTTLLRRLRHYPTDAAAWTEFVNRYGRMIYEWCRRWRLQDADAQDVTQNVLLTLAAQMKAFSYDRNGSFRAWLKTITYRSWCQFARKRSKPGGASGGASELDKLCTAEAGADFLAMIEQAGNRELLERATQRIRLRVQPHTWDAFRLMALEGVSGAEAARRLGMKVGTVFVARSKVQRMLQQEIRRLDSGEDS
jgi:RNA polymerase sigma-70 factor (ECF subfamily)